jgi:hypothetical protein
LVLRFEDMMMFEVYRFDLMVRFWAMLASPVTFRERTLAVVMFPVRTLAFERKAVPETFKETTFSVRTLEVPMFAVTTFALTMFARVETVRTVTFAPEVTFRDETFAVVTLALTRKAVEETFRDEMFAVATFAVLTLAVTMFD